MIPTSEEVKKAQKSWCVTVFFFGVLCAVDACAFPGLEEGRYRRPPPERVGGVNEDTVRGEDFEVVDGPSFGVGTLVGLLVAAATLGGVYLTVTKLQAGPVERKGGARMPERDTIAPRAAPAPPVAVAPEAVAPDVALE